MSGGKGMRGTNWLIGLALACTAAAPAAAQVRTVDPNSAIDADLRGDTSQQNRTATQAQTTPQDEPVDPGSDATPYTPPANQPPPAPAAPGAPNGTRDRAATASADTYNRDDLIASAEGVFGKGAEGLAGLIEKILNDQGEPNAYIAGREASGALGVGLRYGSGTLFHKVEGQRPVYWTGPSIGFDAGGDANKVFVLVYNLFDSQDLYRRFPAAEGRLYLVGGFAATYLRRGDIVLIPVRLGVGWRAGANVGYLKFTEKSRWLPF